MGSKRSFLQSFILVAITLLAVPYWQSESSAAELLLRWSDNSNNEDGFKIERKLGTAGTYAQIASVGANITSYSDSGLSAGSTYCYRVLAFNAGGSSPYSDPACGTVTAYFSLLVTKTGTGSGTVTSAPAGISCGSICSATYTSGTSVTLTAMPAANSTFSGWSGTGCNNGAVTMNANTTCTATFNSQLAQTFTLSVNKAGTGTGTVTSAPAGINCGSTCSATYNSGTLVTLTAAPAADSTFSGWSGTGCNNGAVTINTNVGCTATFQAAANQLITKIGIFRPETGEWFLDHNGNGQWDGCTVDLCLKSFGTPGDVPIVGRWSGNGLSNIGIFNSATGTWQLDTNGNGVWDGCSVDTCVNSFGRPGDLPVRRELSGATQTIIGTFTPQTTLSIRRRTVTRQGIWTFDLNGNERLDSCSIDECDQNFGTQSDLPIVGDWNGTGTEEIGVFQSSKGQWLIDRNGNGQWDGCRKDKCLGPFGLEDDLPVVGDWDGTKNIRIGVFRPGAGQWLLDTNGNGKWDGCTVDTCIDSFGQQGDLPVTGKW